MASINLRLPYPPSVNHYWGTHGRRRFVGPAGREFRDAVEAAVVVWAGSDRSQTQCPFTGRLALSIELTMPDRRRRDIDNTVKAIQDALANAGVYEDDCQIDLLVVQRLSVESPGCADVCVAELRPQWQERFVRGIARFMRGESA